MIAHKNDVGKMVNCDVNAGLTMGVVMASKFSIGAALYPTHLTEAFCSRANFSARVLEPHTSSTTTTRKLVAHL